LMYASAIVAVIVFFVGILVLMGGVYQGDLISEIGGIVTVIISGLIVLTGKYLANRAKEAG